jgi:hypothetical protein
LTLSTVFALALGDAAPASAGSVHCPPDPAEGAVINGNLIVDSGDFCFVNQATINGNVIVGGSKYGPSFVDLGFSTVNGSVTVTRDAEINIHDTKVTKGVSGTNAGYVLVFSSQIDGGLSVAGSRNGLGFLCDSVVGGGVSVSGTTSSDFPLTIGDPANDCAGNQITSGGLSLSDNKTNGIVKGNSIDRNASVGGNSSPTPFDISDNSIVGTLNCNGNTPAPTGSGNAAAKKQGQCVGL